MHEINSRRLTHLIALAEEGSFARAAERVHLSQPALSRSIQALEDELGMKLFDRAARGVAMTHLPFIAASYALAVLVLGGFGLGAWLRVGKARRRLAAIDPRRARAA